MDPTYIERESILSNEKANNCFFFSKYFTEFKIEFRIPKNYLDAQSYFPLARSCLKDRRHSHKHSSMKV